MNLGRVLRCSSSAVLVAACSGELDDPTAYDALMVNSSIRPANSYPLAGPGPTQGPMPSNGGAPSVGEGCDRALEIFASASCVSVACHGTAGSTEMTVTTQVDLNFDQANLATRLKTAMGNGPCSAFTVINAANPAESLLVTKLNDPPPCGLSMPYPGFPALAEADKQCIIDWVYAAAATTP